MVTRIHRIQGHDRSDDQAGIDGGDPADVVDAGMEEKAMHDYILAIDQGTTSSRAVLYDANIRPCDHAQEEFAQHYPASGWVEHQPDEILRSVLNTCGAVQERLAAGGRIAAIGITNQRETTVVWDRETGRPLHPAIVWQDRRTADLCATLRAQGAERDVVGKTGLLLDPYFSATKIAWILDTVEGARAAAEAGRVLFGTIDTYLVWRLTGGAAHVTDATNASRTLLMNLETGGWDEDMLRLFNVPAAMLPEIRNSADSFGVTANDVFGAAIPIGGIAGDQHAACIGQACLRPGMIKSTYGTGCFLMINTGPERAHSSQRLLATLAYQIKGERTYALEGSIFSTGATVQWLRDGLGIIDDAAESGILASRADPDQQVYLVPAFTGLGAPHWDPDCRGALFGLTRQTGPNEVARAALESVALQTHDLIAAARGDVEDLDGIVLRVDGGMAASDWMLQALADVADVPVDRPAIIETTALGAASLAALQLGLIDDLDALAARWQQERRFEPRMNAMQRARLLKGWQRAVASTRRV